MKQGQGIWLPDGDTFFANRPNYELRDYQTLLLHTKGRALAIDVGAHCGIWSKRMAKDFGLVMSFEPMPEHFECLTANATELNVELFNLALGNDTKALIMLPHKENSGMSLVVPKVTDKTITVKQTTLDSIVFNRDIYAIDFIKMDVEGYELAVILGAEQTIKKYKPTICTEILPGSNNMVSDTLLSWGYTIKARVECNVIWQI